MALKETCLTFSILNRCALIGRIYLSLVAYSRQVALPLTNCFGLTILGLLLEGLWSGWWQAWLPTPTWPPGEGRHTQGQSSDGSI